MKIRGAEVQWNAWVSDLRRWSLVIGQILNITKKISETLVDDGNISLIEVSARNAKCTFLSHCKNAGENNNTMIAYHLKMLKD
jgi:hypothetical protein